MAPALELRRLYNFCQTIVYQLKTVMSLHEDGNIFITGKFRKLF